MQELAADLLKGRTVLLVTHDPAEAARLGTTLHILDETGLSALPAPQTPPVREIDAPETLACQARLFRALRASPEAA
jgi:putative hydroxymethylpyrimidine transport system ATP-binding protein